MLLLEWDLEVLINLLNMKAKIDFTTLSNAEINLKIMGYKNEYNVKKDKILDLITELQELDALYIEANNELKKRGVLNDG
jgi:hypothetical protein